MNTIVLLAMRFFSAALILGSCAMYVIYLLSDKLKKMASKKDLLRKLIMITITLGTVIHLLVGVVTANC